MAWSSFNPTSWTNGVTIPQVSDYEGIYNDLRTRGGNVDGAGYGRSNTSYVALPPGELPGNSFTVSAASWSSGSGGRTTYTISGGNIQVGQHVQIASITPSAYNVADAVVVAIGTGTITVSMPVNPGTYGSGGSVLVGLTTVALGMMAMDAFGVLRVYNSAFPGWQPLNYPALVNSGQASGLTSSLGTTTVGTSLPAGMYRLALYYATSTAGSGSVFATAAWTDPVGAKSQAYGTLTLTANAEVNGEVRFYIATSANISFTTTYTGTGAYNIVYFLERLF